MQTSVQNSFKNVVITAWKQRWSEQKWTMTMRKLLPPGQNGDFQMADVLFTQAFVGSSPNYLLLNYFNYGVKAGNFSYAAILSAISKHEDLGNVTSMKYILEFLTKCMNDLNKGQVFEESMPLCRTLLVLLQWLLRNIEQYLKGTHNMSGLSLEDVEGIVEMNCLALKTLTTSPRTACLLTIARFEQSSVWSHIETDLAVIKNAADQHKMQVDVIKSCQLVSQLSRCHTKTSPIFALSGITSKESNHFMVISMLILLEVEWNKSTDVDALIQQLLLIARICNLTISEMCMDVIRASIMGFLGSLESMLQPKWSAFVYLILPQYLNRLSSSVGGASGARTGITQVETDFRKSIYEAFVSLLHYDSLLDMLDQVSGNTDCLGVILDQCLSYKLIDSHHVNNLKGKRNVQRASLSVLSARGQTRNCDPNVILKCEQTVQGLLSVLDSADYMSEQESLLSTLSQMLGTFDIILASASASENLQQFSKKLMLYNDTVKINKPTGENSKVAQLRCLLFDYTFLLVCQIAQQYGKDAMLATVSTDESKTFLCSWIHSCWPSNRWPAGSNNENLVALSYDDNRVQMLLSVLRKGSELALSLQKWNDLCTNLPQAFLEILKAWQFGVISETEITGACNVICNTLSYAVRLSCLAVIGKYAEQVSIEVQNKHINMVVRHLVAQGSGSPPELQSEKRYKLFRNTAAVLLGNLSISEDCSISRVPVQNVENSEVFTSHELQELLTECGHMGWVNRTMLKKLDKILHIAGPRWFCHQLVLHVLTQTRKDLVERNVCLIFSVFQLDVDSLTICLLRHEIPHFLTNEDEHLLLSAPAGVVLTQLAVSCLATVLHNISLQQKVCLVQRSAKEKLLHRLLLASTDTATSQTSHTKEEGGPNKLRRLFSSTAEHDLAGSAFSSLLSLPVENPHNNDSKHREPVLRALSYCLDVMHMSLNERQSGPQTDFAIRFVYLASSCGELVSQAVLQLMPSSMVTQLTSAITTLSKIIKSEHFDKDFNILHFTLSVSDLGHPLSRQVAAKAVCQISIHK